MCEAIGRGLLEGGNSKIFVQIQNGCWKADFQFVLQKDEALLLAADVGEALVAGHGARNAKSRGEV